MAHRSRSAPRLGHGHDVRRGDWAIAPEVLVAASNESVIAVRELERLGVPESTSYRRCRDGEP
jgi:hypothetical protein